MAPCLTRPVHAFVPPVERSVPALPTAASPLIVRVSAATATFPVTSSQPPFCTVVAPLVLPRAQAFATRRTPPVATTVAPW